MYNTLKEINCTIGDIIVNVSHGKDSGVYEVVEVEKVYRNHSIVLDEEMFNNEEIRESLKDFNFETDFFGVNVITTQRRNDQAIVSFFDNIPHKDWTIISKNNNSYTNFGNLPEHKKEELLKAYQSYENILMRPKGQYSNWVKFRPYNYDANVGKYSIFDPENIYVVLKE